MRCFFRGSILQFLTGEALLTKCRHHNGGTIILIRSLWISLWVCAIGIVFYNLIRSFDGSSFTGDWSLGEAKTQTFDSARWFVVIFGGAYASLYARFASQWSYIAGMYNQIKACESGSQKVNRDALAAWKAGFIEDAHYLHLATKDTVAPTIRTWAKDPAVKRAFWRHTPGGRDLLERILDPVGRVVQQLERDNRG